MGVAPRVRRFVIALLACAPLCAGCGDTVGTAPAVEPSAGPGVAAGGGKAELKAPPFAPAGKAEKSAPEKPAEKK
jgi:hypothetical protein